MAVLKLSQVSASGSNFISGDFLIAVQGGTTDILFTGDQVFAFANLVVESSNVLGQRNSTNAQTFRVYNTYTDTSNYERGVFDWSTTANTLTIGAEKLGSGTLRSVLLVGDQLNIGASGRTVSTVDAWYTSFWRIFAGAFSINYQNLGEFGLASQCFIGWTSSSRADNGTLDTGISRGAAGVLSFGNGTVGDSSATIAAKTKAGAFTSSDVLSGTWALCRDTSGATTKLIYNNAGTLMTVALT